MLPAHLAENVRKQVLYYLQSTFDFRDKAVEQAFQRFLEDPETGLFKGPWVLLRRPFRPADQDETVPFDFTVPFHPFKHQNRAWRRLNSRGQEPRHTIVTTGTGSGKTECFLYPILDHCLRMRRKGQKGIKAIILYPMNALAADQERRFAKIIWNAPILRQARVQVGNYTGRYDPSDPGASSDSGEMYMAEDHGISNHLVLQDNPPDILLTNYKMLDYLLIRPQDQRLWRFNPGGVLRYLVLDELHTYDGAQGADVACLIRRLKERLEIPKGGFCIVGTSATLDDREALTDTTAPRADGSVDAKDTSSDRLARFASTLFEEDVHADAVIGEDRLTVEEIVHAQRGDVELPAPVDCEPHDDEDAMGFARRQAALWHGPVYTGPPILPQSSVLSKTNDELSVEERQTAEAVAAWTIQLGEWLKGRELFRFLLEVFQKAEVNREGPVTWKEMVDRLAMEELAFKIYPKFEERSLICASFFALVAQAREVRSGTSFPLVPTQVQLWIRELRRLGRLAHEKPVFNWLDEPTKEFPSLPVFHCSECGESGWIALIDPAEDSRIGAKGVTGHQLLADPTRIYRGWFGYKGSRDAKIVVLSPWQELAEPAQQIEGTTPDGTSDEMSQSNLAVARLPGLFVDEWFLCAKSLVLRMNDGPCPLTADPKRFRVKVNRDCRQADQQGVVHGDQACPNCGSKEGVFFIGSQAATLSSVAIDELFGSVLNSDPKLLAFTDSVQDASHRAGFFTARTYQFTFRTALQHVIDSSGPGGLPLSDAGRRILEWWSEPRPGWPGAIKEAMASLVPPDLHGYTEFLDFRNQQTAMEPPRSLSEDIERRLTWEATREFGLMQTHGRTMEPAGSACLGWDQDRISQTVGGLRARIPGIDSILVHLTDDQLSLWIHGFLHRHRVRGALDHPYLAEFARVGFWGKYPFGRTIPGRETYPPAGHYKPHLMVTQADRAHDNVLAPSRGTRPPWNLVWASRAFRRPRIDETSVLDLIHALLTVGTETGLFRKLHQDGAKLYYAIAADAAVLVADRVAMACSQSGRSLIRPPGEAALWDGAPSTEYYAEHGVYRLAGYTARQRYYQDRYHKGALRRVVASEHTGLLATEEREALERSFARSLHTDDPNVLTCTSTLEMGIDIGDLSSTMLCSIPPSTASYLQRIGRAGRATGTALIVSVVNQRPHDLFFYGRPAEMLRGKVDPPGCWLDASAVLVRQYLAFCFDSATKAGELADLPRTGKNLVDDMARPEGHLPRMMRWVTNRETELRDCFLKRFHLNVQPDTRERFLKETATDLLLQRMHLAANEFDQMIRDLDNARKRLREQLAALGQEEVDAREEIDQELRILQGRMLSLSRTTALEILTDNGLLPNYAFPERGVRFYGSIYNKHRKEKQEHRSIDVVRPAGVAIKELAPANHFYTHRRCFDIQQIAIGNPQQPLVEKWAICGACGHMRPFEELTKPDALPACPQCGHDRDNLSQLDQGQQRNFLEFARSQALSQMEHYESLSADRSEEREREYYQILRSFDLTRDAPTGAVGDEQLPFGIEYRASIIMREVNVGYQGQPGVVAFGVNQAAPDDGFRVCKDCGIVTSPDMKHDELVHRRSCRGRKRAEKLKQEHRQGQPYAWENLYLYRELKSEAIRLLLPMADDDDIDTLSACLHLGLRLRFEGSPAHLNVVAQIMPDSATGMRRHYLVLMDAVPGGTGYLKTLFQEKDKQGLEGEGIVQIMRLARSALETCTCRQLRQDPQRDDPDGCYRCIRTYHQQYNASRISRERGITLLGRLIESGERRRPQQELDSIRPSSLFGSMLEKKFVDRLREFVGEKHGFWEQTIIRGSQGFRFSIPGSDRLWDLELQPQLGPAQGVSVPSQPDFLLRSDDDRIKPLAIFTDGFQFHCHPVNRLADDMVKRRAIVDSRSYHVWNITWDDLEAGNSDHVMVAQAPVAQKLEQFARGIRGRVQDLPDSRRVLRNGMQQVLAFLDEPAVLGGPDPSGWSQLATFLWFWPLQGLSERRTVPLDSLASALAAWRRGGGMASLGHQEDGEWIYNDKTSLNQDLVSYATVADVVSNRRNLTIVLARIGDSEAERTGSDFPERWRRFLAGLNLFQFIDGFRFWASSEADDGTAPDIPLRAVETVVAEWQDVLKNTTQVLRPYVKELAAAGLPVPAAIPKVEHFSERIDDDAFAELAWPHCKPPLAVLTGDQVDFASKWQGDGWKIFTPDDLPAKGISDLIDQLTKGLKGAGQWPS
jgi:DEAD/DEAH box helicase domain-containing protein